MSEKKFIENSLGLRRANIAWLVIYAINIIGVALLILGFLSFYYNLFKDEYIIITLGLVISIISLHFINVGISRYNFTKEGLVQVDYFKTRTTGWDDIACVRVKRNLLGKEYICIVLKNNRMFNIEYSEDILFCLRQFYADVKK